ncbi:uncharacterized protein LOC113296010 [Papaver somniferum]|uniref:uncharacterized protein LOC113296010 n=1 Tax=Papaver somniferum TaxID=3469 RepID=UPI000E7057BE|nr:uncharacterized protein LOC113296010 [Papaver somniferum]
MGAATGGLGVASNYIAEVMALVIAGEWAVKKGFTEVCFSLDSLAALKAFSNGSIPWIVKNRWSNIKTNICNITSRHSYREINFPADKMAKNGVQLARGTILYYDEKPNFLGELENEDGLYFRFMFSQQVFGLCPFWACFTFPTGPV